MALDLVLPGCAKHAAHTVPDPYDPGLGTGDALLLLWMQGATYAQLLVCTCKHAIQSADAALRVGLCP